MGKQVIAGLLKKDSTRIVQCKYYPFCIKFVKSKRDSVRSKLYGCEYIISRNRINELATVGTKR